MTQTNEATGRNRKSFSSAFCAPLRKLLAGAAALVVLAASPPSLAQSDIEDFYKGKTFNIIIGYSPGGGYDLYARTLGRHIAKHIPGNPTIVPQNMPGAGSLRAANYLYNVAPRDGSVIGTFGRNIALEPLLNPNSEAQFDAREFNWLGSMSSDVSLCVASKDSGIETWEDLSEKEFVAGGNQAGSDPDVFATALKNLFGANIRLVTGYPGSSDLALAMQRGEIDGFCGLSYSTLKTRHADWLENDTVNLLVQASAAKHPDLPNVPLATDLATTPEQRQVLRLLTGTQEMARPFAAPPGIPEERRAALEKAFADTMKDPEFLAEVEKASLDLSPIYSEAIDRLMAELYATPKPVVETASRFLVEE